MAPDLRGYGGTDAPADPARLHHLHLAGDVVGLLNALGEGPAVVVGHDWGAPLAWNTALFRPDLVRGVAGLSVPYVPRGDVDVLTTMSELLGESNYQAYFQHQGAAEDALEADPERFLRRFVFAISGDNPEPTEPVVPARAPTSSARCPTPTELPAWFTRRGPRLLHRRVHPHRLPRRPQLVPRRRRPTTSCWRRSTARR